VGERAKKAVSPALVPSGDRLSVFWRDFCESLHVHCLLIERVAANAYLG
jgi:hypothetical protein